MALPKFLQSCFPSYDLTRLDRGKDKNLIVMQILNYGTEKEVEWLGKNYSRQEIRKTIQSPTRGMWLKSVLQYWTKIFGIKLSRQILDKAVIDLNTV